MIRIVSHVLGSLVCFAVGTALVLAVPAIGVALMGGMVAFTAGMGLLVRAIFLVDDELETRWRETHP